MTDNTLAHRSTEENLVELLLEKRLMTTEAIDRARSAARASKTPFSAVATKLGLITEYEMAKVFAEMLEIDVVRRPDFPESIISIDRLNPHFLRTKKVLPLGIDPRNVALAMADPSDDATASCFAFAVNRSVQRFAALESELDDFFYKLDAENIGMDESVSLSSVDETNIILADISTLSDLSSDAPVIRLVNRLIMEASDLGASDIHFEPESSAFSIRFRIDGLLQKAETLSLRWADPVASRIKLMAKLDIAEKRVPQDGRIRFTARGRSVDLRIATFPSHQGESIVIRLLGQQSVRLDLDTLDLSFYGLNALKNALKRPHGIILITGPTGSGKTTTLYASLNAILNPELKIVTVEDPIEYVLEGVSQLQIKPEIDLTYATALRSILRNDPDIIMIGEIRDRETADIAIRAALTGHLVLSTLHTNTAAGAITRLLDLGVEAFLLASTIELTAAQRLVRKLCPFCKNPRAISKAEAEYISTTVNRLDIPNTVYTANGCSHCKGRGYSGRTSLFEAIEIDETERDIIRSKQDENALIKASRQRGGTSLWQHGIEKALAGETSLEEVLRVVEWRKV
ncbi:GspE/PulE family protein [Methylomonas sp. UP202]|uniref:GspE/PulE family protein n=1 Tax=Methylomonas sp. UP202 TaxID=3040943 RepID=UPI002478D708|nr:GspE/PulE family protein [Methylomonas sp. UP202]WGS88637.1 GspE/PulE family protein [Methylomonas sp. UP202]